MGGLARGSEGVRCGRVEGVKGSSRGQSVRWRGAQVFQRHCEGRSFYLRHPRGGSWRPTLVYGARKGHG